MDDGWKNTLNDISENLRVLGKNFSYTQICQFINPVDGSIPEKIPNWLKNIHKISTIYTLTDEQKYGILYLTAKKSVSDFINKFFYR